MKRPILFFLVLALLYAGAGLLPGHTFAPLDLPLDADAWKPDPATRVRVSNSLLGDVVVQFIPWDREILRMLARGELPWVNRFAGEGGPLFANPQTALFSPFTWPRLILGLDGWALMGLMKVLAAALCAYWFARELGVSPRQALVSGFVYATAGYTVVWLLYPITHVFALIPGLAAAALRLMKVPSIRNAAWVILFGALCSAGGHPETLFIAVVGVWSFLAWEALRRPGFGFSALVPSSVGAFLGFLLLAVQVVPFLVVLGDSYAEVLRPQTRHPFRVWGAVSQVLPGVLGTPLRGELDLTALPAAENFNVRVGGYVGALVLMLLVLAWRELPGWAKRGLAIGSVALVLSWYPPGLWPVLRHVPVMRVLTLEYLACLFVLFGAMAAGPALAIVAARRRRKIGAAIALAGLLAFAAGILPLIPAMRGTLTSVARSGIESLRARGQLTQSAGVYEERLAFYLGAAGQTTARRLAVPGACWFLAGVGLLLPWSDRRRGQTLAIAAGVELLAFGIGFNPAVRMIDVPEEPPAITAIRELDPERRFLLAEHFEVFPANLATLYEVRDAISYDALNTKEKVSRLLPAGYDPALHTFHPILSPDQVRELARIGVRFVLSRNDVAGARRIDGTPAPAVGVYEIDGAMPSEMPANNRPAGLIAGIAISLLALVASAAWLRLYLIEEPGPPPTLAPPA